MAKQRHIDTVALVGGETLLGREIRDVFERAELGVRLQPISTGEEFGKEPVEPAAETILMQTLTAGSLAGAAAVVLSGSAESSAKAYALAGTQGDHPPVLLDVTGALEDKPEARLRAPALDGGTGSDSGLQIIAHPAALILGSALDSIFRQTPFRRSVVHIFEPVSARGQRGLEELQQQTVGLLSFQTLKKEVFDTQVSFNMLPQYGSEAPHPLLRTEGIIERHLASALSHGQPVPMPSLRLVHAPVFHGYSLSLWIEFESEPDLHAVAKALEEAGMDVRSSDQEPPSNVGVAGQSGITAGALAADRNCRRACWLWLAADNLRIAADAALEVAREVL